MKRRLSVAMALIGDPKIVYLDEPVSVQIIKGGKPFSTSQPRITEIKAKPHALANS
jgi:ABC-type Na+ transport system ATPase subunit NatA